jgi:MFS family permease
MKKEMIKKSLEKEKAHHTRRLSIKEGIFWTIRQSFGGAYVIPFTIFTGASNFLVAITNSLWYLSSVSQVIGGKIANKFKRKKILTKTLFLESIGWMFLALIGLLYLKNIYIEFLPIAILISFSIIMFAGGLGHPAWFSWIGDLVDSKYLGRWFSKRNTIISFMTVTLTIGASLILEQFKSIGKQGLGFTLFFLIAFLARLYCIAIIRRHYEPKKKKEKHEYSLKKFLKKIKSSNFGQFVLFRTLFAFSTALTAPLVAIYLLKNLQFDYFSYILITLSGTIFSVLTLNLWGKIADKFGNYRVIAITTLLIPLTPIWWTLSTSKIFLFLIPGFIGGTTWTAFIIASGNFIYDNVPKEKRPKAISYFNLFIGVGALLGGLVGAGLLAIINPLTIFNLTIPSLFIIFWIGAIARMVVVGAWIPKLKEIKHKEKIGNIKSFEHLVLKEAKHTLVEDIQEISSIPGYIKEK